MAISTSELLNSLKLLNIENNNIDSEENRLDEIEEEKEEKNSLTLRLEQLMNSEKLINERLKNFDQKYKYFNGNSKMKKSQGRYFQSPKIKKENKPKKNPSRKNSVQKISEKTKIDLYRRATEPNENDQYNLNLKTSLQMFKKHQIQTTEITEKRKSKYPNYREVKLKKKKIRKRFIPSQLDDFNFEEEKESEEEEVLQPENLDIEMQKKPSSFFSKFNSTERIEKKKIIEPKQLSFKISELSAIDRNVQNDHDEEQYSYQSSFLEKNEEVPNNLLNINPKKNKNFFSFGTPKKRLNGSQISKKSAQKDCQKIGIFRFENPVKSNTKTKSKRKNSYLNLVRKQKHPKASKIKISKYIRDISREKKFTSKSQKKIRGFHDLGVIERNEIWLKAKIKRAEDLKLEKNQKKQPEFQPQFTSKKLANKLGINKSMMRSRKSISWRRTPSKNNLSRRKGNTLNRRDISYMSVKSGVSLSKAMRESRSYGKIHRVKQEYIEDDLDLPTDKILE